MRTTGRFYNTHLYFIFRKQKQQSCNTHDFHTDLKIKRLFCTKSVMKRLKICSWLFINVSRIVINCGSGQRQCVTDRIVRPNITSRGCVENERYGTTTRGRFSILITFNYYSKSYNDLKLMYLAHKEIIKIIIEEQTRIFFELI